MTFECRVGRAALTASKGKDNRSALSLSADYSAKIALCSKEHAPLFDLYIIYITCMRILPFYCPVVLPKVCNRMLLFFISSLALTKFNLLQPTLTILD